MKKTLRIYLLATIASFSVLAEEQPVFQLIAIDMPFVHQHMANIVTKAYEQLEIPVNISYSKTVRSQQLSDSGHYDGDLVRAEIFKSLFKNLVPVDISLGTLEVYLACARHISSCDNKALNDGRNTLVLLPGQHLLNSAVKDKDINLVTITHINNLTEMLKRGRVDYTLVVKHRELNAWVSNIQGVTVAKTPIYEQQSFHFIHKRHQPILDKLSLAFKKELALAYLQAR